MRTFKITFITLLAMIMSVVVYAQKPKIRIIATGGTIAGV